MREPPAFSVFHHRCCSHPRGQGFTRGHRSPPAMKRGYSRNSEQFCRNRRPQSPRQGVPVGDSHANAISGTVMQLSKSAGNVPFIRATISSCPPATWLSPQIEYTADQCKAGNEATLHLIKENPEATVLIVARWTVHYPAEMRYTVVIKICSGQNSK